MKIRNVISVVAMLSILLFGIGTAHAVWGINDDVPQQDLVVPLICEKNGQLDTLFAIADKDDALCHYVSTDPSTGNFYVTSAAVSLWDQRSRFIVDWTYNWTRRDIVTDTCSRIFDEQANNPASAEVLVNGKTYFVGYLTITQSFGGNIAFDNRDSAFCADPGNWEPTNRFMGWEYLVDLSKGFASGFNMPGAENGLGQLMGEGIDQFPIAVHSFYPRFYYLNDKAETMNWWVYLLGQNELAVREPFLASNVRRVLTGLICDEQENCTSLAIPIPYELNIIEPLKENYIPGIIKSINGFPGNPNGLGGFAILKIFEWGTLFGVPSQSIAIDGTWNGAFQYLGLMPPVQYYSAHAWSYQREQSNDGLPNLSWDVIHPQHRTWCSTSDPENGAYCGPQL